MDRQLHLKIKLGSLAAEQRLIRRAEQAKKRHAKNAIKVRNANAEMPASEFADFTEFAKGHMDSWAELRSHRMFLRRKARENFLAYGFLRGTSRLAIEANPRTKPNMESVEAVVQTFTPKEGRVDARERFARWWKNDERPLRVDPPRVKGEHKPGLITATNNKPRRR